MYPQKQSQVSEIYNNKNSRGEGFNPVDEIINHQPLRNVSSDDYRQCIEIFKDQLKYLGSAEDLEVFSNGDMIFAVGDAHGPWAVDVSKLF